MTETAISDEQKTAASGGSVGVDCDGGVA